ncbi:hypothetical protein CHUAL_013920 [Chamberlinius hualienensis]
MPSDVSNDATKPRLCHIIKWDDFNGFGFNLHAEKSKQGQFIGKVDEGSPAESAGLREGDRIIEVNGVNVSNENHKQVVERIKAIPSETKLLVVDQEAEKYYKNKKIVIKSTMSNVVYMKTAPTSGRLHFADNDEHSISQEQKINDDTEDRRSQVSSTMSDRESPNQEADKLSRTGSNLSTPSIGRNGNGSHSSIRGSPSTPPLTPPLSSQALDRSISADSNDRSANLNLNMTASQMRALLATKKNPDGRGQYWKLNAAGYASYTAAIKPRPIRQLLTST